MQTETIPIRQEQLLKKANEIIRTPEDFIQGMYALHHSVTVNNNYAGNKRHNCPLFTRMILKMILTIDYCNYILLIIAIIHIIITVAFLPFATSA
ncbi:DUF2498 family protein [Xenorhabdus koppenhoeferi]|uniref:Uncharacterized protein n=1 Tax=Xenorhabdus koppenhoeferi TaxID=351659 RepID=A0A1I7JIQ3_9GAMM|nr:DUF2498 family protein [Xenorhabdus koppenhoeferi]SFU85040.1 Protein of unknown function [Xenorhabdus koppenhoeferi]